MVPKKSMLRLFFRLAVLLFLVKAINSSDEYVNDLRKKCFTTRRPYFCVTFRISKFVQDFDYQNPDHSVVKLVKVKPGYDTSGLFPTPRFISTDSDWDKFVKFFQRKLVNFLSTHGVAFEVPNGVQVVEGRNFNDIDKALDEKSQGTSVTNGDGRGHKMKQKKIFILSIIIMAKLIKILILVSMIFFVLLLIKKIILVTAIVFPSVLSHIKQACQRHHHQAAVIAEESPSLSSSWFGWRQDNNVDKPYWS